MFLLRASGETEDAAGFDLRALVDGAEFGPSSSTGVADDDVLIALSEAVTRRDALAADEARAAVRRRLGDEAFVDVAAVIATFNTMDRIADGSGIPLDGVLIGGSEGMRAELGLGRFASAANTPGAATDAN